jgi:hypothetical protein
MADAVFVVNLADIQRSVAKISPAIGKASRLGLRQVAEPIRIDAGRLARANISGLRRTSGFASPAPWSIQRAGLTLHELYIVPKQRGLRGRKTPGEERRATKFVELMYGRSYEPALKRNEGRARIAVDNWLDITMRAI